MKGNFYLMISSRMFTALLKYKVNTKDFNSTCEQLKEKVKETFESESFTNLVNIITAEYSVKIDNKKEPEVEIVVIIYAMVDSTVESDKGFAKLVKAYIDTYCEEFENIDACLIKRRVI